MSKLKSVIFLVLLTFAVTSLSYSAGNPSDLKIGDKVSDFTIKNFDGHTYSLSNSGSEYTVIMFWSTVCPNVQPYTSRINSLAGEYMPKGVSFWAVNSNNNESTEEVKNHKTEKGYPFPVLKDNGSVVADLFGAQKTPEVFVVDKNMTLVYHGRIDNDRDEANVTSSDLKNALDDLLAGRPVAKSTTVSFGCGIKRK
ncbi:MAG: thioredoxin family protein [Bacteroidetes bacterium]|nr:thioredoxin family protein [Bacteroidota bacterium]